MTRALSQEPGRSPVEALSLKGGSGLTDPALTPTRLFKVLQNTLLNDKSPQSLDMLYMPPRLDSVSAKWLLTARWHAASIPMPENCGALSAL